LEDAKQPDAAAAGPELIAINPTLNSTGAMMVIQLIWVSPQVMIQSSQRQMEKTNNSYSLGTITFSIPASTSISTAKV